MNIGHALENEKHRKDKLSFGKIFLHKEGKFIRIYNWSAWLVKTIVCTEDFQRERGDDKPLSVGHYKTKNHDYVMIGFPTDSLSKFIPEYDSIETLDDGTIALSIAIDDNKTYEMLLSEYTDWYEQVPIISNTSKSVKEISNNGERSASLGRSGVFNILSKVLSYPVERMTPSDNIEFISNIKQEITWLL